MMGIKPEDMIIKQALSNTAVYNDMAAKENAYWSSRLSDQKVFDRRTKAMDAAKKLGKNKDKLQIPKFFHELDEQLDHGLVLGCGNGRAERSFLKRGICKSFHGIDIAEGAVAKARKIAKEKNLPITYSIADLNEVVLEENSYNFVSAQNFLHHVVKLEYLIEQIWKSLRPGGYLVVNDFVGETQFQWLDKRLEICGEILDILPEKHKVDAINNRPVKLNRPDPGNLCSPFEAIRSGEILPILRKWFDVDQERLQGSIQYHVLPIGVMESYLETEDTETLYKVLHYIDKLLVREGVLPPTGAQMILRPKK